MSSKTYFKVLLASFLIGIGISVVGCGSSGNKSAANPSVGNISAQAVVHGQTPNNCMKGIITTALDGTSVCKVTMPRDLRANIDSDHGLARVTPSMPATPQASRFRDFGYILDEIQPNDKLTLKAVDGAWGYRSTDKVEWGMQRYNCDKTADTMGLKDDGTEVRNEGVPSGLFLSTGHAVYPAFGPSVIYFNEAGPLLFGFNTPAGEGNCFSVKLRFKIERCLDVASLPHKCK